MIYLTHIKTIFLFLAKNIYLTQRLQQAEMKMQQLKMIFSAALILILSGLLTSCFTGPDSPLGFSLPKGDASKGEQVMLKHQCLDCHTLNGYDNDKQHADITEKLPLGGKSTEIVSYSELVTSVINPSHKFSRKLPLDNVQNEGQSKMISFNDVMTVTELVDLVSFLQPKYELQPYTPTAYRFYYFQNEANKN